MIEIRPYADSDRDGVARLWREVFPDSPPWNRPEEDIDRKMTVQPDLFLIAVADEEIVGTAMGGFDGHRGWVHLVAVRPSYRRKGIGEALMREVEKGLARIGCTKLNLQVRSTNQEVVAFYRKIGYQVEDRISMAKRLDV